MESIDKLRIFATNNLALSDNVARIVNKYLDAIESEITDCYMLLPMDADGVPIHVGDKLECNANGYEGVFTVFAVGYKYAIGDHEIEWIRDNPDKWFHFAAFCHHVKPRTLEDVLEDYVVEYQTRHARSEFGAEHFDQVDVHETIKRCADEIRKLLGFEIDEPDTIHNELFGGDV